MKLSELMQGYADKHALGAVVETEPGLFRLTFDGVVAVDIEEQDEGAGFSLFSTAGVLPADPTGSFMRHCMSVNLFARGAYDAFVAVNDARNELVVIGRYGIQSLDVDRFQNALGDFVMQVTYWRDAITTGVPNASYMSQPTDFLTHRA